MATPQKPESIIKQSLLASSSYVTTFQNALQAQSQFTQQTINGCNNAAPNPGSVTKYGKVLSGITYVPLSLGNKFKVGRNNIHINYIVLARIGQAADSIGSASFLQGLNDYINLPQVPPIAPHIVIGYQGNAIQIVDMDNTANFLELPPQPPPSAINASPNGLIDALITLTAGLESGGATFSQFRANDNNHGASYGFIQFNQEKGDLCKLMQNMNQADTVQFNAIFGSIASTLQSPAVMQGRNSQGVLQIDLTPYKAQFVAAGQLSAFQAVQVSLARQDYFDTIKGPAATYNLKSQRAFAMLFDTNVQGGIGNVKKFLKQASVLTAQAKIGPKDSDYEKTFLAKFAVLADTLKDAVGRRTKLLNYAGLSDGPLYFTLPSNTSTQQVQDESCIFIALEGRYGDPVTSAMLTTLAKTINACSTGCSIGAGTNIIPWTAYAHGSTPIDPTMGNFPFPSLFSQLLNPVNAAPVLVGVFVPPQPVLSASTNTAIASMLTSISQATTTGQKLFALQAYDQTKGLARALLLANADRGGVYSTQTNSLNNSTAVLAAQGSTAVTNSNSSYNVPNTANYQANTIGLVYDFSTGLWSDGKPAGKIALTNVSTSTSSESV